MSRLWRRVQWCNGSTKTRTCRRLISRRFASLTTSLCCVGPIGTAQTPRVVEGPNPSSQSAGGRGLYSAAATQLPGCRACVHGGVQITPSTTTPTMIMYHHACTKLCTILLVPAVKGGVRIINHDLMHDRGTKHPMIHFVTVQENSAFPLTTPRIRLIMLARRKSALQNAPACRALWEWPRNAPRDPPSTLQSKTRPADCQSVVHGHQMP